MSVAHGGSLEYDLVKKRYLKALSANDKEACLQALGRTKKSALAQDLLQLATSSDVPIQDSHQASSALAANNFTRDEVWKFTRDQWARLHERLGKNNVCMDRWMKMGLSSYTDSEIAKDIAQFFQDKDTRAFDRTLVVIRDTIRGNAKYKERDEGLVLEWLQAHGYASR